MSALKSNINLAMKTSLLTLIGYSAFLMTFINMHQHSYLTNASRDDSVSSRLSMPSMMELNLAGNHDNCDVVVTNSSDW